MIPKPISPTELRQNLYSVVREVADGTSRYLVTPSQGDAVVLLSREDYNAMIAERALLRDLRTAEADIAARRTYSLREVRAFVARPRKGTGRKTSKRR